MIRINEMIRHNVCAVVLRKEQAKPGFLLRARELTPLHSADRSSVFKETDPQAIGIELENSGNESYWHRGEHEHNIERLESYASLKRKNKEKTQFIRTLSVLFFLSIIIIFLLCASYVELRDTIYFHMHDEHPIDTIESVVIDKGGHL